MSDVKVARFEFGMARILGDQPVQSRRSLLQSMYPELREGADWTAAIDLNFRDQPTMNINSFVRRVRRAFGIQTTHVWRRDDRGLVSCAETQEMSLMERSTSFRGPPEHIFS